MLKNIIGKNKNIDWLFNDLSKENAIIHNDIDGLLTMGFLQHYAGLKQIVGIYDLTTFYMKEDKYLKKVVFKDMIGLDLDVSYFDIRCIGHHMTCVESNENSFNINNALGLHKDLVRNYYKKYPLNTVILLYSLFGIEPKSDEEIALLVYADSVFKNYCDKYRVNVENWLIQLKQFKILDALKNRFDKIMEIIDTRIVPITSQIKDYRSSATYSQCPLTNQYTREYKGNPSELIDLIRKIMKWNIIDLPSKLNYKREFNNVAISLSDNKNNEEISRNLSSLKEFLNENKSNIVSSSMTYKNAYKITINIPNTNIVLKNNKYMFVPK